MGVTAGLWVSVVTPAVGLALFNTFNESLCAQTLTNNPFIKCSCGLGRLTAVFSHIIDDKILTRNVLGSEQVKLDRKRSGLAVKIGFWKALSFY